jgi:hypothetical protein
MSAQCSVDAAMKNLLSFDSKLTFDALISRAATKAFAKVFKVPRVDVGRVNH